MLEERKARRAGRSATWTKSLRYCEGLPCKTLYVSSAIIVLDTLWYSQPMKSDQTWSERYCYSEEWYQNHTNSPRLHVAVLRVTTALDAEDPLCIMSLCHLLINMCCKFTLADSQKLSGTHDWLHRSINCNRNRRIRAGEIPRVELQNRCCEIFWASISVNWSTKR